MGESSEQFLPKEGNADNVADVINASAGLQLPELIEEKRGDANPDSASASRTEQLPNLSDGMHFEAVVGVLAQQLGVKPLLCL